MASCFWTFDGSCPGRYAVFVSWWLALHVVLTSAWYGCNDSSSQLPNLFNAQGQAAIENKLKPLIRQEVRAAYSVLSSLMFPSFSSWRL